MDEQSPWRFVRWKGRTDRPWLIGHFSMAHQCTWCAFVDPEQGESVMPDFDDPDQKAKDHGNLIDEGVAEVESEAAGAAGAKPTTGWPDRRPNLRPLPIGQQEPPHSRGTTGRQGTRYLRRLGANGRGPLTPRTRRGGATGPAAEFWLNCSPKPMTR